MNIKYYQKQNKSDNSIQINTLKILTNLTKNSNHIYKFNKKMKKKIITDSTSTIKALIKLKNVFVRNLDY